MHQTGFVIFSNLAIKRLLSYVALGSIRQYIADSSSVHIELQANCSYVVFTFKILNDDYLDNVRNR